MKWIREVIVDILVTLIIGLAVFTHLHWLHAVIMIYTGVVLLLRILTLLNAGVIASGKLIRSSVPLWFYHLDYGINILIFVIGEWWITAAAWAVIWALSFYYHRQNTRSIAESKKKAKKK